jgi:hypothetical protein
MVTQIMDPFIEAYKKFAGVKVSVEPYNPEGSHSLFYPSAFLLDARLGHGSHSRTLVINVKMVDNKMSCLSSRKRQNSHTT